MHYISLLGAVQYFFIFHTTGPTIFSSSIYTINTVGNNEPENQAVDRVNDELMCSNYFAVRKALRVQNVWPAFRHKISNSMAETKVSNFHCHYVTLRFVCEASRECWKWVGCVHLPQQAHCMSLRHAF
jgi:hypothetical protein